MPYLSPDPQFAPVALRISNRSLCLHTQLVSPVGFLVDPRSPWRQVSWSGLNRFAEKEISHFVSSFWKTFKKAKHGRSSILTVLFGKHFEESRRAFRDNWSPSSKLSWNRPRPRWTKILTAGCRQLTFHRSFQDARDPLLHAGTLQLSLSSALLNLPVNFL